MNADNPAVLEKRVDPLMKEANLKDQPVDGLSKDITDGKLSESLEIFISDDNIIHIQESQVLNEDVQMEEVTPQEKQDPVAAVAPSDKEIQAQPPPDRRSERLKKDTTLTTKERNEKMQKKES